MTQFYVSASRFRGSHRCQILYLVFDEMERTLTATRHGYKARLQGTATRHGNIDIGRWKSKCVGDKITIRVVGDKSKRHDVSVMNHDDTSDRLEC